MRGHYTKLRKAGLSRQKQVAVRDLCRHVVEERLPLDDVEEHDDEVRIERLTAGRGIGRWSAQMFLMFQLGRLDQWPVDDLGVRKGVALLLGTDELPKRKEMEAWGELVSVALAGDRDPWLKFDRGPAVPCKRCGSGGVRGP